MKKVLMLASVASMIGQFNIPNIEILQEMGYQVDVACNFKSGSTCSGEQISEWKRTLKKMSVRCYQIDFSRDVTDVASNMKALWQVEYLLEKNQYEFVHCHSPIGGVIARIAGKLKHTKVIYTAHGFHFFKGAPKKNWLLYYPVEKFLSRWTDTLITINHEDYERAKKKFHAKKVVYVPGVGIDLEKFSRRISVEDKRKALEIEKDATWILSVGELIERKNHELLIRAVARLDNVYCTIAGMGELQEYLQNMIYELGVEDRVKLLGFRTDISELCEACDIFVFPSFQEGLPVALMEAMASGKPVACSSIRGNTDLLDEGKGGYFFDAHNEDSAVAALQKLMDSELVTMGEYNREKIKAFDLKRISKILEELYKSAETLRGGGAHLESIIKRAICRQKIGCENTDILLLSVGELNKNKNHRIVIRALAELENKNIHYVIAGQGELEAELKQFATELGVSERVHFLGFRADVAMWYAVADIFVFPSYREGLSVSLMEAMASGLPCIVSRIRGNVDLIDEDGGMFFDQSDWEDLTEKINSIRTKELRVMGDYNAKKIRDFGLESVSQQMKEIYMDVENKMSK